jgi:hypothetical protein
MSMSYGQAAGHKVRESDLNRIVSCVFFLVRAPQFELSRGVSLCVGIMRIADELRTSLVPIKGDLDLGLRTGLGKEISASLPVTKRNTDY